MLVPSQLTNVYVQSWHHNLLKSMHVAARFDACFCPLMQSRKPGYALFIHETQALH
jgi:hypothetical protein